MKILPSEDRREWIVVAEWYGAPRTVFGPADIYACIRWRARREEASR